MGLFSGKLFDFNEDGKVDFGESVFGISSIGALVVAAAEEDDFDEQEALLDDMIAALEDMEANMPDNPDSWVYARWERKYKELERKIDELNQELYR